MTATRSRRFWAGASSAAERDPDLAAGAHLVRRTSMGVHAERVRELADLSWDDAIDAVLAHRPDTTGAAVTEEWGDTAGWWIDRMTEADTGLTDRMTWFWHGMLTTNAYKVSENALLGAQLDHLRANALGNFRHLLQGFIAGGALLEYLDASYSMAANPNENLARELMELFTIGRGHYTEDDVRAAARALAGWVVADGQVEFRREHAFIAPLLYMGQQAEWDMPMIVDHLCDHPATATRISARLWEHLVGSPLDEQAAAELGGWWQDEDLEIQPLVERILRDPSFASGRLSRPRSGLEWYCAVRAVAPFEGEVWYLNNLGQMPYLPPSVAGWPRDNRWLSPGSLLARAAFVHNVDLSPHLPSGSRASSTEAVLDRCSLHEVSAATVQAMDAVEDVPDLSPEEAELVRWRLAFTSPEFNLL